MSYYLGGGGGYPQGNRAAPKSKDEDMEAAAALSALALGFAHPPSMSMPMPMQMPMPIQRSAPRPEELPLRYLMGQQQRSPPMPPAPYYRRDSFDTWGQRRLDTHYQHLPASMEQALRGDEWEAPYEPYRYPPLWYQRERERQRDWMASDMPPMPMHMPNRMMAVSRPPVYPPTRPPVTLPPPPQQHVQSAPVARAAPSTGRSTGGNEGMTRNESRNEKRRMQRAQMEKRKSSYRGVFWQGWGNGSGKWNVQISLGSKMKSIGFFTDEIEAARAYDRAAQQYLEDPVLNFLPNGEPNPYRKLHRLAAKRLIDASGLNAISASSSGHGASLHHLPPRAPLDPPSFKSMPARGGLYGNDSLTALNSLPMRPLAQSQFHPPPSSGYSVPGWAPRDGRQGEGERLGRGHMEDEADAEARGLLALRQARALVEVQAATDPMLRASEQRRCVSNAATQRGMAEGPGRMSASAFGPQSTGIAGGPPKVKKPASSKTRVIELSPPRHKGVQGRRRRGQEEEDREDEGRQSIWPEEDAKIQARRAKQEALDPEDVEVGYKEEREQPEARKGALSRGRGATTPSEEVGEAMDEDEEEEGGRSKGAEGGEGASAAQSGKVGKKRRFTALEPPWFFGRAHREAEERRKKADERRRAVEKAFAERAAAEEAAAEKGTVADKAAAEKATTDAPAVEKVQSGDEHSEAETVGSEARETKGRKSDDKPKKRRSGLEPPWFLVPRPSQTDKKEKEGDSASEAEEKATRRGAGKGEKSPNRAVQRRSGLELPWFLAKREEKKTSGVQSGDKGRKAAEAEDKARRRSGPTGPGQARAGTKTEEEDEEEEEEEESGNTAGETKVARAEAQASKAEDGKGESGKAAKKRSVMALDPPWFLAPGRGAEVVGRRREEPERRGKKDGRTPGSRADEEPSRGRGKEATSLSDKSDKEEAKTVKRRSLNAVEPPWPWFLSGGGGGESAEETRRKSAARRSAAEEPKATGKRKEQEGREARHARKATVQDEEEEEEAEEEEEEKAAQGKEEGKASEDQTAQKAKRRKRPELEEPWFFGAAKAEGEGRGRRERTPGQAAEEGAGKEEGRPGRGSRREGEGGKEEGHRDRRSKAPQAEEGSGRVVRRFAC